MDKNDLFNTKSLPIIMGAIIIIAILFYYNSSLNVSKQNDISTVIQQDEESEGQKEQIIIVHISGEVNSPGIVELKYGQRLYEALELVGGTTDAADVDQVNLAMILEDQQKISIPSKEKGAESPQKQEDNKININTAEKSELMTLPGIGETIADSIIQFREENNNFKKLEEIKNVPRIGDVTFERIKEKITCY